MKHKYRHRVRAPHALTTAELARIAESEKARKHRDRIQQKKAAQRNRNVRRARRWEVRRRMLAELQNKTEAKSE